MQVTDLLARSGGLGKVASALGMDESQVQAGAQALLPAILGGFKKQVKAQPAGAEGVEDMLRQIGGAAPLDPANVPGPEALAQGNQVLAGIFGSKDVSRAVAQGAAAQTGVDAAQLRKMLPMLAMMVAGYMAKHESAEAQPSGRIGEFFERVFEKEGWGGKAGLAAMLDLDGDGNPLDDILEMARKVVH